MLLFPCSLKMESHWLLTAVLVIGCINGPLTWAQEIKELRTFEGHKQPVRCIAFSPDGTILASGAGADVFSDEKTAEVKLWEVASGKPLASLPGHKFAVYALAFTPDGRTLVTAGTDGVMKLWDVSRRKEQFSVSWQQGPIGAVAISLDGKTLAAERRNQVVLWDLHKRRERLAFPYLGRVDTLAFSPDNKMLAVGSTANTVVTIWDAETAERHMTLKGHTGWIRCLAFTPDGHTLVSGSVDKTVKLWDMETGKARAGFTSRGQMEVGSLSLTRDGTVLAWATYEFVGGRTANDIGKSRGIVKMVDPAGRKVLSTLIVQGGSVSAVAFSPDDRNLATGADRLVKLWDVASITGKR